MKKKRFSVEQIVGVLRQAEVGIPVVELIRKVGISEQTFYRWKAKYVGLEVDQVRQMKQLQEENLWLKQLVAELTLDKAMLQDVLSKNGKAFAAWADGGAPGKYLPSWRATELPGSVRGQSHVSLSQPSGSTD